MSVSHSMPYKRHRMFDTAKVRYFCNNAVRFFCQKLLTIKFSNFQIIESKLLLPLQRLNFIVGRKHIAGVLKIVG